jgi:hypothetical protein
MCKSLLFAVIFMIPEILLAQEARRVRSAKEIIEAQQKLEATTEDRRAAFKACGLPDDWIPNTSKVELATEWIYDLSGPVKPLDAKMHCGSVRIKFQGSKKTGIDKSLCPALHVRAGSMEECYSYLGYPKR